MGAVFAYLTFYASVTLHRNAIARVMKAPQSFFDTTPIGRIMNRFSKGALFRLPPARRRLLTFLAWPPRSRQYR